jgi:hypothetical protein
VYKGGERVMISTIKAKKPLIVLRASPGTCIVLHSLVSHFPHTLKIDLHVRPQNAHIATGLYGFIYHVYLGIALHLPWYMDQR